MQEKIIINTRRTTEDSWDTNELFSNIKVNVSKSKFIKSHFYSKNMEMTSEFKEYIKNIFDVTKSEELIKKMCENYVLIVEDGEGDPELDLNLKNVTVYYDDFDSFYWHKKNMKNSSKAVKYLFDDSKNPSTNQITKIIEQIAERSSSLSFIEKEKDSLKESIPIILSNNNIRLNREDVFEINKVEVEEIINIGRMILKGDRRAAKQLGVSDVKKEQAWQKYFEKYGTYLLFGSVKLDPQVCLDKEKTKEFNHNYPDILTRNRYGFIDIIELKKSSVELFRFDGSHNKLVPTSYLSGALSQLNGYLQTIPYAFAVDDAKKQSLECASGMLIIGDSNKLIRESAELKKWCLMNNVTEDDLKFIARQELRKLNYSYSHMQVVLYDEVIDTLEQFINNIK